MNHYEMGQLQQCTVIIVRSVSVVFVSLSLSLSLSVSQLVLLLTQARGKPEGRRRMQPGCAGQRDGLRPGQGGQGGAGGGGGAGWREIASYYSEWHTI